MMAHVRGGLFGVLALTTAAGAAAQTLTLTEATNVAVARAPDGALALDALGRIWLLDSGGGEARPLTDADGDARQPTWSPDGRWIAFQAYWAGDYDIWVVGRDGSGLRQVTAGPYDDREPHWSPDGARIAFSSDRGGSYDIWEVDVATGAVRRVTDGPGNEYGPAYAPDGRRLAYVADGEAAGLWIRDGAGARQVVAGSEEVGDVFYAPAWSPDGSTLTFHAHRYGFARLFVTADDGTGLGRLNREGEDVFPFRTAWVTADTLLYTADGGVRVRSLRGGSAWGVPFLLSVSLERPSYTRARRDFDDASARPVRGIVSPAVSPDGSRIAFSALGDLWVMPVGGAPERLTDDVWVEVDAMWSPDGTRLVYTSDRDGAPRLWVHEVDGGVGTRLTEGGGRYPVWSPDGTEVAYVGQGEGRSAELRVVSVATGAERVIRRGLNNPGRPTWSPDGRSVAVSALWTYSTRFREGVNRALVVPATRPSAQEDHAGAPPQTAAAPPPGGGGSGEEAPAAPSALQEGERWLDFVPHGSVGTRTTDGPVWSPDGRWMAYVSAGVLWVVPMGPDGAPAGPPRRLTNELADDPTWTADGAWIVYLSDERLRRIRVDDGTVETLPVPLEWSPSSPQERYTLHAARVFDGVSDELVRNVDILVEGRRIREVVPHDDAHHADRVVDASEGVVSPGLIEMHTHGGLGMGERLGRIWLSFGVTSVRIPAGDAYEVAEAREAVASGRRVGPRTFGTGGTVDGSRIYYAGAPSLSGTAQIDLELGRARALGYDLVKTYVRLPDAVQARVIRDAHALGIPVTSHELYPAVAHGADGVEHVRGTSRRGYSTKISELNRSYDDVVRLLAASGMSLTPTVGIYGGYALLAQEDPSLLDDPRVETFFPWARQALRARGALEVRRRMVRDMASLARRVVEAGGVVVAGTDSPIIPQGISLVAEMEELVRYGGMRPADVMRAATSATGRVLGYEGELGVVRPGALADLVVFGGDPLADIRKVRDVRRIIKDGHVFTPEELLAGPRH